MRSDRLRAWVLGFIVGTTTAVCAGDAGSAGQAADRAKLLDAGAWQFAPERLIPIEMPPYVRVRVGVDPQTLRLDADGAVHYVVVMQGEGGAAQALHEAIRCASSEVITLDRAQLLGAWKSVTEPQWRDFRDNMPSRHAWAIARQGLCDGLIAAPLADIARRLRRPIGN